MGKLKVGDVFVVPTGDGRAGVGQVAAKYGKDAYFFVIFDGLIDVEASAERVLELVEGSVLFLSLSMDAKLHAGHWTVVGNAPVRREIPMPAYKVAMGKPGDYAVEDYSGVRRREATPLEADALPYRKVVAPVRLEKALRAHLGLLPWDDAYDELRPAGRATTVELFG